ncbi:DUF1127 domain-containing protein [Thalassococcus sp. S3]|uniref:DUF1127 domain-containing protein n=1 Tax=Thalassococcus sp. S3 TaxID=2017482 RepID=UPI001024003A|nr:DUF1127 domain-containing protein [Thalassococcus sp. S3]QBF32906.1 hypothetical protein CFI11_17010 [Thalassococcus sp. S3]
MAFISASRTALTHRPARRLTLGYILSVWRQRQDLKRLDTTALRDIGISKTKAQAEAARPIWDVPATWRM